MDVNIFFILFDVGNYFFVVVEINEVVGKRIGKILMIGYAVYNE